MEAAAAAVPEPTEVDRLYGKLAQAAPINHHLDHHVLMIIPPFPPLVHPVPFQLLYQDSSNHPSEVDSLNDELEVHSHGPMLQQNAIFIAPLIIPCNLNHGLQESMGYETSIR